MGEPQERQPRHVETVAVLDGEKVLKVTVGGEVRAIQNIARVDERIEDLNGIIASLDDALGKTDAEHLAVAHANIDARIADLARRKAELTAETLGPAVRADLSIKRTAQAAQRDRLIAARAEMAVEAPAPTEP